MRGGQLVEIGDARSVLSNPAHSYTRRLIAAVPSIERRHRDFTLDLSEVPSLVKPRGFEPKPAAWREIGADHRARVEGGRTVVPDRSVRVEAERPQRGTGRPQWLNRRSTENPRRRLPRAASASS